MRCGGCAGLPPFATATGFAFGFNAATEDAGAKFGLPLGGIVFAGLGCGTDFSRLVDELARAAGDLPGGARFAGLAFA